MKNKETLDSMMSKLDTTIYMFEHALNGRRKLELYLDMELMWVRIKDKFLPKRLRSNI